MFKKLAVFCLIMCLLSSSVLAYGGGAGFVYLRLSPFGNGYLKHFNLNNINSLDFSCDDRFIIFRDLFDLGIKTNCRKNDLIREVHIDVVEENFFLKSYGQRFFDIYIHNEDNRILISVDSNVVLKNALVTFNLNPNNYSVMCDKENLSFAGTETATIDFAKTNSCIFIKR